MRFFITKTVHQENFNNLIDMGDLADGYTHYSNDVEKGKRPTFIRASEDDRKFDERRFGLGLYSVKGKSEKTAISINKKDTGADFSVSAFLCP